MMPKMPAPSSVDESQHQMQPRVVAPRNSSGNVPTARLAPPPPPPPLPLPSQLKPAKQQDLKRTRMQRIVNESQNEETHVQTLSLSSALALSSASGSHSDFGTDGDATPKGGEVAEPS